MNNEEEIRHYEEEALRARARITRQYEELRYRSHTFGRHAKFSALRSVAGVKRRFSLRGNIRQHSLTALAVAAAAGFILGSRRSAPASPTSQAPRTGADSQQSQESPFAKLFPLLVPQARDFLAGFAARAASEWFHNRTAQSESTRPGAFHSENAGGEPRTFVKGKTPEVPSREDRAAH